MRSELRQAAGSRFQLPNERLESCGMNSPPMEGSPLGYSRLSPAALTASGRGFAPLHPKDAVENRAVFYTRHAARLIRPNDGQTIEQLEADLKNNLYKMWNRMSSGTYFPPPVRAVSITNPHVRPAQASLALWHVG
jgi:hypothetical protein